MEWPRIVPHGICIYVLYVCYNSKNKQQQQLTNSTQLFITQVVKSAAQMLDQYISKIATHTSTTSPTGFPAL